MAGILGDSTYSLYGNFGPELKRVLDILTGHYIDPSLPNTYYVYSRTDSMMYYDYRDPYVGSPEINCYDSRIFADYGHSATMTMDEMYYYTDSYAGLGISLLTGKEILIDWSISDILHDPDQGQYNTYHIPYIRIGVPCVTNPYGPNN